MVLVSSAEEYPEYDAVVVGDPSAAEEWRLNSLNCRHDVEDELESPSAVPEHSQGFEVVSEPVSVVTALRQLFPL